MNIKELLKHAAEKKASDLHLVVDMPPTLRIDGELVFTEHKEVSRKEMEDMVFSILEDIQKKTFLEHRALDFGYKFDNFRFRVNIFFEKDNIALAARVITEKIPNLDELGMPKIIYNLLGLKQGLILLTGPTGCGKSTSLAAMIDHVNENKFSNIITLEDPIEYVFKPKMSMISQRQLGTDMTSFTSGLKHALRQDPNVIMVGEMRDLETIATTITLAETGHLVLATLHTYSAAQTIDRIIDAFPPHQQNQVRLQLSMVLASVISQRLIPKADGGRIASREILINTPAIANLIRENKISQIRTLIETSSKEGMRSMDQDVRGLFENGLITKEVAATHMSNPESLGKVLR